MVDPPAWLESVWLRLGLIVLGLTVIWVSFRFNLWSRRQRAIDSLAEDLSWAIKNLLNADPRPSTQIEVDAWEKSFHVWCNNVSKKLEKRAFFTRADQLHFDRLGFVNQTSMTGNAKLNWLFSMLSLKFSRLRDVINWTQTRGR